MIAADFPPATIVVFRGVGASVRLAHLRSLLISLTSLSLCPQRLAEVTGFEPACHGFGDRCFPFRPHPKVPERYLESTQGVGLGLVPGSSFRAGFRG